MNSEHDPRVRAFWRQAAAVIAASGGITGECQQKLRALADHLQLSESEWQIAWQTLQSQEVTSNELTRYEQAFTLFLQKEFSRLPNRLLSLKVENKAARIGIEKYQIGEVRTRQLIEWESERLQVKRISRPDAEQYVEQVIIQQLEGALEIDETTCNRLATFARQWGLERELVEWFIRDALQENRIVAQRALRRRQRKRLALQLACLVIVLTPLAWLAINRWVLRPDDLPSPDPQASVQAAVPVVEWWPGPMLEPVLGQWDVAADGLRKLQALGTDDQEAKRSAYADFWSWLILQPELQANEALQLLQIVSQADPQIPELDRWLTKPMEPWFLAPQYLPLQSKEYEYSFRWWQRVAVLAGQGMAPDQGTLNSEESKGVAEQAAKWLELQAPGWLSNSEQAVDHELVTAAIQRYWANQLWGRLFVLVRNDPARCAESVSLVWSQTQPYLDRVAKHQYLDQAVLQLLLADIRHLTTLRPLIPEALKSNESSTRLAWLELCLKHPNSEPLGWLIQQVVLAGDPDAGLKSVAEGRRNLVAELTQRRMETWSGLAAAREQIRHRTIAVGNESVQALAEPTPESIARLAIAANLQLWLAEQTFVRRPTAELEVPDSLWDWSEQRFQALQLSRLPPEPPRGSVLLTPADQRQLEQIMSALADPESSRSGNRQAELERLQKMAPRIGDLRRATAEILAGYYLRELPIDEWLAAERALTSFRVWPQFVLTLADQIPQSTATFDQASKVVQSVCEEVVAVPEPDSWRSVMAQRLRDSAEQRLESIYLGTETWNERYWQELSHVLDRVFHQRRQWHAGLPDINAPGLEFMSERHPSRWLLQVVVADGQAPVELTTYSDSQAWDWLVEVEPAELGRILITLNQLRDLELQRWGQRCRRANFQAELQRLQEKWKRGDEQTLTAAQKLVMRETQLMELWQAVSDHIWIHEILEQGVNVQGDLP